MKLALLTAAWLAGLGLGLRLDAPALPFLLLLLACPPVGFMLRLSHRPVTPALLAAVGLLGLLHAGASSGPVDLFPVRDGQNVTLTGRIVDDPITLDRHTRFKLAVDSIASIESSESSMRPVPASGNVLAYVSTPYPQAAGQGTDPIRYGTLVRIRGTFERPAPLEDFDYSAFLSGQGISGVLWVRETELLPLQRRPPVTRAMAWIFDVRGRLSASLDQGLGQPQSALANAFLLGRRESLSEDVTGNFRATGGAHLLAISGLHVGILLVMTLALGGLALGRRRGAYLLVPLLAIWLYALLSGLPLSVVRAAVMGSVYLAALALGRPRSILPALALSAGVMAAIDPKVLEQISFQLSFTAMAGIALALPYQARAAERMEERVRLAGPWWWQWVWQTARWLAPALIISVAATLATWPLIAFIFNRVPLLGIVTTLLAMPALPFILIGSVATAIGGLVHPIIGQGLGWIAWLPISYLLSLTSNMPAVTAPVSWAGTSLIWVWYAALAGLLLLPGRLAKGKLRATVPNPTELMAEDGQRPVRRAAPPAGLMLLSVALVVGASVLWSQLLSRPDGNLRVYFLDVGQGDSTLIVTPSGKQVLVDGGPGAESAAESLSGKLPLGDRSLDLVVLTHLDDDHSRGLLAILERYSVGALIVGNRMADSPRFTPWQAVLDRRGIPRIDVESGFQVELEPGVAIDVLNPQRVESIRPPKDRNNDSVVLRLSYDRARFLLAADIEAEAEGFLARNSLDLDSAVLKVSHHGSGTSTTQLFLDRVSPLVAVVSAGEDNSFGHPASNVIDRLEGSVGAEGVYRTDQHGTVEITTDGSTLWVRPEKQLPSASPE